MIELLAPAKNLECGIAAIDHGADAVYIGAQRFGARAAAGNSVEDIAQLCNYAHQFGAKVYVTVNTILYDEELADTEKLIWELYRVGVDALLIQDMAVLSLNLPPIPLHASTQTDNRSAEKVQWLQNLGFSRTVLARELSISEISDIHRAVPDMPLEVFVHGALCVSYSGQCYASQYCFSRSANRGECAQFCRLAFDLIDGDGRIVEHNKHLLSLRDMCQIDNLDQLINAGATSFKIEGRLKDVSYVKNVVAAYSQRLNQLGVKRASHGKCQYTFQPQVDKSFNRGFTTYFAHSPQNSLPQSRLSDMSCLLTPKATGQVVGHVKEVRRGHILVSSSTAFCNGDGLCFFASDGSLVGFRVNRAEGNKLFLLEVPAGLRVGMTIYRNHDKAFNDLLAKPSATRKLSMRFSLCDNVLHAIAENGREAKVVIDCELQKAEKPQCDNIIRQLSKLGNTPFEVTSIDIPSDYPWFIPSSILAQARRDIIAALSEGDQVPPQSTSDDKPQQLEDINVEKVNEEPVQSYLYNASNEKSRNFYHTWGIKADSIERPHDKDWNTTTIMQCRYCIRHALGACLKQGGCKQLHEPLTLSLPDGQKFRLQFDCKHCQMNIQTI